MVLIADDSPHIRSILGKLISQAREDIAVRTTSDVTSTLRAIDTLSVDVLILDIGFPDGSGLDVLRHVNTQAERPCIIVLTNNTSQNVRAQSLRLGADLFFDKTEEYENVVEEIVRRTNK